MILNKKEIAGFMAVGAIGLGCAAYVVNPEKTNHAIHTAIEEITPDNNGSASSHDGCTAITNIPLEARVGSLVLPMAAETELDLLETTMTLLDVSNFALLGHPSDTVIYHGAPTAFSQATNGIISTTEAQNGIATTFALDEEGGTVQRVDNLDNGAHKLISAQQMALSPPNVITETFKLHGEYLASLGVTTVFGPVTDVGTEGADGSRSFSNNPEVMAVAAMAVIEGLRQAGLQATVKHLPDYGQSPKNSDHEVTSVPPISELEQFSLGSISQVLTAAHPAYVMTGNYLIPGLSDTTPASLSPVVYVYIRDRMGFEGAFITDALNAGSIQSYTGLTPIPSQVKASIEAINAGADIVIISLDATSDVVAAIKQALADATVSEATLNRASSNALEAKGYDIC